MRLIREDLEAVLLDGPDGDEPGFKPDFVGKSLEDCLEDLDWLIAHQSPDITLIERD